MHCSHHGDHTSSHSRSFTHVCMIQGLRECGRPRVYNEDSDGGRVTEGDGSTMVSCLHSQADVGSTLKTCQISQH